MSINKLESPVIKVFAKSAEAENQGSRLNRKHFTLALAAALIMACCFLHLSPLLADEVDVLSAEATALGNGQFRIAVTVEHADAGWDHYANRWDVIGPNGDVLGERILAHPHDNEQPFTRSLTLTIPASITSVMIRANDSVHGLGGRTVTIEIPHQ